MLKHQLLNFITHIPHQHIWANLISISRAIIGISIAIYIKKYHVNTKLSYIAYITLIFLLFIAQISDYADGIVARKFILTSYGQFIDSAADRIFAISILYCILLVMNSFKHKNIFIFCTMLEVIDICLLNFHIIPIQYHEFYGYSVHFTKFSFGLCSVSLLTRFILLLFRVQNSISLYAVMTSYILKGLSLLYYISKSRF